MDCIKIFQAPFSDPRGEANTFTHSKKSLFHTHTHTHTRIQTTVTFFPHKLHFISSPSFSNVLRCPACGYILSINATDIKQPHQVLNEADLILGKQGKGREVSNPE